MCFVFVWKLCTKVWGGVKTLAGSRMIGCRNLQKILFCGMCCVTAAAFLLSRLSLSASAFENMICFPFGKCLKLRYDVNKLFVRFLFLSPLL